MAKLAIKGHPTRGDEVIEILKMLGGKNIHNYGGTFNECYAIDNNKICTIYTSVAEIDNHTIFTLEQFEEKYPYKVGDKVVFKFINTYVTDTIKSMEWYANGVVYTLKEYEEELMAEDLQPFKEETMKDKGTLVEIDLTRELCIADEVEVILGDYEFVLKNGKTYFVKKKPKYPKTYEECCNILGIEDRENGYCGYEYELLGKFQKLFICRNAYWKIAGEQMGLGTPWSPDWGENDGGYRYCIRNRSNKIVLSNEWLGENYILSFPTEEMRDAFYDNFKELIESCKELL